MPVGWGRAEINRIGVEIIGVGRGHGFAQSATDSVGMIEQIGTTCALAAKYPLAAFCSQI
jgi:hypothetical protein